MHIKLSNLVNGLVNKIQSKHESLIEKTHQLTHYQKILKEKYHPIFEQLEGLMREKKMDYLDHMTSNLEKNHDKTLLE